MRQLIKFSLLSLLIIRFSFSDDIVAESTPVKEKNNTIGVIITVTLISASAAAGGYLFYRFFFKDWQKADSVISIVEKAWDSSAVLYSLRRYNDAISQLQKITDLWYDYEKYSKRFKRKRHIDPIVIRNVIASCNFLKEMVKTVDLFSEYAEQLPLDEFELANIDRKQIIDKKAYIEQSIDSIMYLYPNHRDAILYSFSHIRKRIEILDSLLEQMYQQKRKEFSLKNRFYYNQAVERKDTSAILQFIDDCSYYQVEKEWCFRARMLMEKNTPTPQKVTIPNKKMSVKDSIQYAFTEAIESGRIELIEAYIKKYSSRKYSTYKKIAMIDSATKILSALRENIDKKLILSNQFPLFANIDDIENIHLTIKGLSDYSERAFNIAWDILSPQISRIPFIRAPASLTIDYTANPPTIMLDAFIITDLDIEKSQINAKKAYKISCLVPTMSFLEKLRDKTIDFLKEIMAQKIKKETMGDFFEYEIKKIKTANFVVRLSDANKKGYIVFYAKGAERENSQKRKINFYDFYDISTVNYQPKRIPIYPGSLPFLIPELSSDPIERWMCSEFFE
ncbi:MAG: hypothetical protein N2053_07495 [Chitinispirillaceae bacterium]|nr:hypothetical protein [Chitinispirillaceae bacterium]